MITIIDKDGTEFSVPDGQLLPSLERFGVYDIDVAVYREREWFVIPLSQTKVGDFFRKLRDKTTPDRVYLITRAPRVIHHPKSVWTRSGVSKDPDIYLEGLKASTLSYLYQTYGQPSLTASGKPFSPTLLRLGQS